MGETTKLRVSSGAVAGVCCQPACIMKRNMRQVLLLLLTCVELIYPSVNCNTTFTADSGTIKSPLSASSHCPNDIYCVYTIQGGFRQQKLEMTIQSFSLEDESSCNYDYLRFGERQRYCGDSLEEGRVLRLCCEKTFSLLEGTIKSPNDEGSEYSNNLFCTYTVEGSGGTGKQEITLTVERFHLEGILSTSCTTDYLQLGDEGRFCGLSLLGRTLKLEFTNSFKLIFKTDGSVTYSGFIISYKVSCSIRYTAPEGVIMSPPGPDSKYPHNADCTYTIDGGIGQQYVTFTAERFSLESHTSCNYDYLQFGSGAKHCGTTLQGKAVNYRFRDSMRLSFKTDGSTSYTGFTIRYLMTCNTTFSTYEGTIGSPVWNSDEYPNDVLCSYNILGSTGTQDVSFSVEKFRLETQDSCSYDYLQFSDGRKYCGSSLQGNNLKYELGRSFKLLFKTDGSNTYSGFIIQYKVNCNTTFTADSGTIKSPLNVSSHYPDDIYCVYTIQGGSRQQKLEMTVQSFSLEYHSSCDYDYLRFGEGRKYCGDSLEEGKVIQYEFTGTFKLYFKTDGSKTRKGFVISYTRSDQSCESGRYGPNCGSSCSEGCSWECDKTDGTCSCKSGYTGSKCDTGCSSGRYGSACNGICSSGCSEDCNKQDGKCTCKNGWTGPKCETDCPDGTYGYYCVKSCSPGCADDTCDKSDGGCTCKPGYTGKTCNMSCDHGKYGVKCASTCSGGCSDVCNIHEGNCTCKPGYKGLRCDRECSKGTHGSGCSRPCNPGCEDICDKSDGSCTCKPGYKGQTCEAACKDGKYGRKCSSSCSEGCSDVCNTGDGTCTCKPGYKGSKCDRVCDEKKYGRSCVHSCSEGCSDVCNTRDGTCTCKPGYTGSKCDIECSKGTHGSGCSRPCNPGCEDICDKSDGLCTCKPGYKGHTCEAVCDAGTFGRSCMSSCSEGCSDVCNNHDGTCTCKPGYMGSKCDKECSDGTHGNGCLRSCSPGCHNICDKSDGSCSCKEGYTGETCDKEPTLSLLHVTLISSACGVAGLAIVILLIVVFVRRRRKTAKQNAIKRTYDMEFKSKQTKTFDTNCDADSVIYFDPDEIPMDPVYENNCTPQLECSTTPKDCTPSQPGCSASQKASSPKQVECYVTPIFRPTDVSDSEDESDYLNVTKGNITTSVVPISNLAPDTEDHVYENVQAIGITDDEQLYSEPIDY